MKRSSAPMEIKSNGIVFKLTVGKENKQIIREAQEKGLRYRTVNVMSGRLKGKTNLHGQPYKPSAFIYVEKVCDCVTLHFFDHMNSMDVNNICTRCNLKRI